MLESDSVVCFCCYHCQRNNDDKAGLHNVARLRRRPVHQQEEEEDELEAPDENDVWPWIFSQMNQVRRMMRTSAVYSQNYSFHSVSCLQDDCKVFALPNEMITIVQLFEDL